jgi:ribosomal protein S18 acetylase RimI-like enzyme
MERIFPNVRHLLAARGAMELMMNEEEVKFETVFDNIVRPLKPQDAKHIALIHQQVFPDYPSTKLGLLFCTELYRLYAKTEGAFGFVIWHGGERVGFVAGGNFRIHEQIIHALSGKAAVAMLVRPQIAIKTISKKLSKIFHRGKNISKAQLSSNEKLSKNRVAKLVLIGVKENARGTGAAIQLLQSFCCEAKHRGFESVTLSVRSDNVRARAAYEKAGWIIGDNGGESVEYNITIIP